MAFLKWIEDNQFNKLQEKVKVGEYKWSGRFTGLVCFVWDKVVFCLRQGLRVEQAGLKLAV